MSTFDHVLTFSDEAAAHAALFSVPVKVHDRLPAAPISDGTTFNPGCTIPGMRVYIPGTPDTDLPGYHLGLATVARSAALEALPQCRAVIDRDAMTYAYVAADVNPATLSQACVSPMFGNYPGGRLP